MLAIRYLCVPLVLLAAILALGAGLGPRAVAYYHLEMGGRLLERALGEHDPLQWWYVDAWEVQDDRALQGAVAHLRRADEISHSWRLLGQALAAQGDLVSGIQALERFTASRPEHPLGHLELAAAYALADQRLGKMEYTDLLAALPGARVSAPDLGGEVAYQPAGWGSDYVYPTTYGLPPNYGDRPTLFLHAGSSVTYTVTLTEPAVLRFGMGLELESLGWGGDGATYEVLVDGERIYLEHLPVEVAQGGWQERALDLAPYAGQSVSLTLTTTPGPVGDITGDWAGWGEPRIEAPEAAAYRQEVTGKPWLVEWKKAGVTPADFILAGEGARRLSRLDEALAWYEKVMVAAPDRADSWYYRGMVLEQKGELDEALSAYRQALKLRFVSNSAVKEGDIHGAIGRLLTQLGMQPEGLSHFREGLQAEIGDPQAYLIGVNALLGMGFHNEAYELLKMMFDLPKVQTASIDQPLSDLRYEIIVALSTAASRSGDLLATARWAGLAKEADPNDIRPYANLVSCLLQHNRVAQATEQCRVALTVRKDVPELNRHCASVFYQSGQYGEAIELLENTVALDPGDAELYVLLGDVLKELGRTSEAIEAFETALMIDPAHTHALEEIKAFQGQ